MAKRTTITQRNAEAEKYAALIREAFDYTAPVFIQADVEGQPDPERDVWRIRAEIAKGFHITITLHPPYRDSLVLGMVVQELSGLHTHRSHWRMVLHNFEDTQGWVGYVHAQLAKLLEGEGSSHGNARY